MSERPQTTRWPLPHLTGAMSDVLVGTLFTALIAGALLAWFQLESITLTVLLGLGAALLFYAALIEPWMLSITRQKVAFPVKSTLCVGLIADFHVGPFKGRRWVNHVVHKMCSLKPDVILIAGDFLFDPLHPLEPLEGLKNLHAPLGVYAVPGNHDAGNLSHFGQSLDVPDRTEDLERFLGKFRVKQLRNESVILDHHGEKVAVAGIDDLWSESSNMDAAFAKIPQETPTIFLTHHPDTILDERSHAADLIVCGHTHGGQVCWPGGYPAAGVPAVVGRKYAHGLFEITKRTKLFVTRGCGETLMRVRFWCRPEIAILECFERS